MIKVDGAIAAVPERLFKRVKLKQGLANSRLAHFLIQSLVNPTHQTCNSRYYLFFKLLDAQVTDKFLTTQ